MDHKILWTSGWDSTYRVLDLVLNKKRTIQPYYIVDRVRVSTEIELETMEKIKKMIRSKDPNAVDRIKPTIFIDIKDIPLNDDITNHYKNLVKISHLGIQYDWLARFVENEGLNNLELSVHIDDTVHGFIKNNLVKVDDGVDITYRLTYDLPNENLVIFSKYNFPLIKLTKLDMEENANKFGFADIMEHTWFCHSPINGKPCGICNPCIYTREEGMGRRVPNPSIKNKIIVFPRKVKNKIIVFSRKVKKITN